MHVQNVYRKDITRSWHARFRIDVIKPRNGQHRIIDMSNLVNIVKTCHKINYHVETMQTSKQDLIDRTSRLVIMQTVFSLPQ